MRLRSPGSEAFLRPFLTAERKGVRSSGKPLLALMALIAKYSPSTTDQNIKKLANNRPSHTFSPTAPDNKNRKSQAKNLSDRKQITKKPS